MNKNKKHISNGLIDGVIYNEEEERKISGVKDEKVEITELPIFPNLNE